MFGINFSKYGKYSAIFLIIILLLSLVLCSCLGGNCFGREGLTSQIPTTYYQQVTNPNIPSTGIINLLTNSDGSYYIQYTNSSTSQFPFPSSTIFNTSTSITDLSLLINSISPVLFTNSKYSKYNITIKGTSGMYSAVITNTSTTFPTMIAYIPTSNTATSASTDQNSTATDQNSTATNQNNSSGNYNHYTKIQFPDTYYANGKTLRVFYANGVYYITVTDPVAGTINYNSTTATDQSSLTKYTFTGSNGGTAVIYTYNGSYAAKVTDSNGQITIYTITGPSTNNNSEMYNNSNTATNTSGSSYSSTTTPYTTTPGSTAYNNGYDYSSSQPQGVSRTNIPAGDEDLYILKSQIVPPVCPACPGCGNLTNPSSGSGSGDKCQPCPACARCKKPNFDCKKVPNYKTIDDSFLPQPVMSTGYSTYGQ